MTESTLDDFPEHPFAALEPDGPARERMEGVVLAAHALSQRPLAAEWLALLRTRPVSGVLLVGAAAATILVATPVGALLALAARLA